MALFKNRSINSVYIHTALQGVAFHGGETFSFVYLLKAGLELPVVLLAIGFMWLSRILLRMAVVPVAKAIGLRNGLVFGIALHLAVYPVVTLVDGVGWALFTFLLLMAVASTFYWTMFHGYVALMGDAEHRGAQVGTMELVNTVMGIVAPALSGLLLTYTSPLLTFAAVGFAMFCSAFPLLLSPNVSIAPYAVVPVVARREARVLLFTDGLRTAWSHFTWILVLFIVLGESFAAFGGAMAVAGLAGAAFGLLGGKAIDFGKGKAARRAGYGAVAAASAARALGFATPWSAIAANALYAVAWPLYAVALNSRLYDLAKQSPCPLRYHVVAEGGWDLGTAVGCLIAAGLIYFGASYSWPIGLALVACAVGYIMLERSFRSK